MGRCPVLYLPCAAEPAAEHKLPVVRYCSCTVVGCPSVCWVQGGESALLVWTCMPLLYLERGCSWIFLSQLYSELLVHIFYPAVKTCEDCVYATVDIGNLIQDFRESGNFLKLVKRTSPGSFFHIFVEEEESKQPSNTQRGCIKHKIPTPKFVVRTK